MQNIITACIIFIVSLVMFVISFRSSKEKGFLFNNAYIYSSKKERANMDKKPHYRQTAIVFLLLGIVCLTIALDTIFKIEWLFYVKIACAFIILIYAIVSSIMISMKK
ncbi:MAG: DUF3784 domain-containing protein [Peptostreptococcaceae bacterium]